MSSPQRRGQVTALPHRVRGPTAGKGPVLSMKIQPRSSARSPRRDTRSEWATLAKMLEESRKARLAIAEKTMENMRAMEAKRRKDQPWNEVTKLLESSRVLRQAILQRHQWRMKARGCKMLAATTKQSVDG
jgi:hypothetical protein